MMTHFSIFSVASREDSRNVSSDGDVQPKTICSVVTSTCLVIFSPLFLFLVISFPFFLFLVIFSPLFLVNSLSCSTYLEIVFLTSAYHPTSDDENEIY